MSKEYFEWPFYTGFTVSLYGFGDGMSKEYFTPASNLGYLAPPPRTIFHGCQIVHWDPLDGKRRCPQKNFGLGYVKLHGFYANP